MISGKQKTALATSSPDLLVVDRESPPLRQKKLQHDIDLQLILGERVLLNTAGIDAKLEGNLRLQSSDNQELVANGEIKVVKGKYSSYGVSLDISRGNLLVHPKNVPHPQGYSGFSKNEGSRSGNGMPSGFVPWDAKGMRHVCRSSAC